VLRVNGYSSTSSKTKKQTLEIVELDFKHPPQLEISKKMSPV